ncbi:TonB-dependent receptor [Brasilonema sp. CT11]|nr:TonB-dependent receptor [Brasilonema sp. CT11]
MSTSLSLFVENTPINTFSLWITYEIQQDQFQGFASGVGFFFVGDQQGDLNNTFELPSYLGSDAAIFYKRRQFRAQVNFRNLFNVDYFETAISPLRVYPGESFPVP